MIINGYFYHFYHVDILIFKLVYLFKKSSCFSIVRIDAGAGSSSLNSRLRFRANVGIFSI